MKKAVSKKLDNLSDDQKNYLGLLISLYVTFIRLKNYLIINPAYVTKGDKRPTEPAWLKPIYNVGYYQLLTIIDKLKLMYLRSFAEIAEDVEIDYFNATEGLAAALNVSLDLPKQPTGTKDVQRAVYQYLTGKGTDDRKTLRDFVSGNARRFKSLNLRIAEIEERDEYLRIENDVYYDSIINALPTLANLF